MMESDITNIQDQKSKFSLLVWILIGAIAATLTYGIIRLSDSSQFTTEAREHYRRVGY